jgi:hypothetical protein
MFILNAFLFNENVVQGGGGVICPHPLILLSGLDPELWDGHQLNSANIPGTLLTRTVLGNDRRLEGRTYSPHQQCEAMAKRTWISR